MSLSPTWESTELPVLEAIIVLLESQEPGLSIQLYDVENAVDLDDDAVSRAIGKLKHEHLVVKTVESLGGPPDYIIKEATPKGLRAAGVWPSEDAAAGAFLRALDQQIEDSSEGSTKKTALQSIRESATRISEGTLTAVFSAAVKGGAGL